MTRHLPVLKEFTAVGVPIRTTPTQARATIEQRKRHRAVKSSVFEHDEEAGEPEGDTGGEEEA